MATFRRGTISCGLTIECHTRLTGATSQMVPIGAQRVEWAIDHWNSRCRVKSVPQTTLPRLELDAGVERAL
jgi:hypothetical protein